MVTHTIVPTQERIYPESFNIQTEITANREICIQLGFWVFYLVWVFWWVFFLTKDQTKQHFNKLSPYSATNPSMERTKLHSYS